MLFTKFALACEGDAHNAPNMEDNNDIANEEYKKKAKKEAKKDVIKQLLDEDDWKRVNEIKNKNDDEYDQKTL